jgi:parallel beta-helix repeat protein
MNENPTAVVNIGTQPTCNGLTLIGWEGTGVGSYTYLDYNGFNSAPFPYSVVAMGSNIVETAVYSSITSTTTSTVPTTTIQSSQAYYNLILSGCGSYPLKLSYVNSTIVQLDKWLGYPLVCVGGALVNWEGSGTGSYTGPKNITGGGIPTVTMAGNITEIALYNSATATTTSTTPPTTSITSCTFGYICNNPNLGCAVSGAIYGCSNNTHTTTGSSTYTTTVPINITGIISTCMVITNSNSIYKLGSNVSCSNPSNNTITFISGLDNVTLNCGYHTLSHPSPTRFDVIQATGDKNITIEDCIINTTTPIGSGSIWTAIEITNSKAVKILNNTMTSGSQLGILLTNISASTISNNILNDYYIHLWSPAMYIINSKNNNISNNKLQGYLNHNYYISGAATPYGMDFQNSSFNKIQYNTAYNFGIGIFLAEQSNKNIVFNNIANNNWDGGIALTGSYNNTVANNIVNSNFQDGIELANANNTMVSNNIADGDGNGIFCSYMQDNNNKIQSNKLYSDGTPINLDGCNNTTVSNNIIGNLMISNLPINLALSKWAGNSNIEGNGPESGLGPMHLIAPNGTLLNLSIYVIYSGTLPVNEMPYVNLSINNGPEQTVIQGQSITYDGIKITPFNIMPPGILYSLFYSSGSMFNISYKSLTTTIPTTTIPAVATTIISGSTTSSTTTIVQTSSPTTPTPITTAASTSSLASTTIVQQSSSNSGGIGGFINGVVTFFKNLFSGI